MEVEARKRARKSATTSAGVNTMRDDVRAFKREIILAAAVDSFYSQGFENTSVDDIAAAMSVTKAVLYYNFASKMKVLETIVDRTTAWSVEAVQRGIAAGRTPPEKLAQLCFAYGAHIVQNQKLCAIFFREERSFPPELLARAREGARSCVNAVAEVLDAGVKSGDFVVADTRLTAISLMGLISQAFYWYHEDDARGHEVVCRHFAESGLLLAGFKGDLDRAAFKL